MHSLGGCSSVGAVFAAECSCIGKAAQNAYYVQNSRSTYENLSVPKRMVKLVG